MSENENKRRIYLVTEGSYSDYHVVAAFSTVSRARTFLNHKVKVYREDVYHDWEDPLRIESLPLDTPPSEYHRVRVWMRRDGSLHHPPRVSIEAEPDRAIEWFPLTSGPPTYFSISIATRSVEQAIKAANEKRAMILALGLWGRKKEGQVTTETERED